MFLLAATSTKMQLKMMFKKLIFAALFFTITATALRAQINVGIRTGMNWQNINYSETLGSVAPDFDNISQFNIGAFAEIPVTDHFSVQPELNLLWKGFSVDQGLDVALFGIDLPVGVMAESKFRYIEVPLLAKYTFGEQFVRAYVTAGPTLGYATKGRIDTKAKAIIEIPLARTPINLGTINYNRFEVGAAIGAGFEADLGIAKAFVDARYTRGFTTLYDIPLVNEKVRNSGFGLNIGLSVPLN